MGREKHSRRSDGRLKAAVTVGVKPDGTPRKKYVYARSEKELERKVVELKLALRTGTYADPGRMTVAEFLEIWRQKHVAKQEPKTQAFYGHMIRHIVSSIGAVKLKDLGPLHVENLLEAHRGKVSGTTLHHIYCTLRAALNKGVRWRLVPGENPCKGVDPPSRSTGRPQPYTRDEILRLLAAAKDDPLYALYLLALWTGMREGELLGLKWEDIDLDSGWLRIRRSLEGVRNGEPVFGDPKTEQSERDVPLSPALITALREHKSRQQVLLRLNAGEKWRDHGLVFTNRHGGPLDPSNLRNRHWYPLLRRAGLRKITIHGLRHTAATVMLTDLGYDVKTVQELLGHTEARTTMDIYGHGRDHKKREAVRRMDSLLTASKGQETDLDG